MLALGVPSTWEVGIMERGRRMVLNSIKIPRSCEKIDSSGIVGTGR